MAKYSAILTRIGLERMAAAAITGDPVDFAEMAVGDGSGTLPEPDPERSALVNEVYRSPLNRLVIADKGKNIIRAEMVIPPQVGGFTLREAALYDSAGICLAIASLPESYKPLLAEGAGRVQAVNIWIAVSNTDNVQLTADLSVVMATVAEVEKAKSEGKDYTDQVATAMNTSLETAIKDAIEKAKRDFWEEENPPGTVRFFAQNIDPNEKWPWSEWVYTGENKTIRIGKADGSDVGATGGSDTVTLQRANLPAVQINVTGSASEVEEQRLRTGRGGGHKHKGGMAGPGEAWDSNYIVGSDNDSRRTRNYTSDEGEHDHEYTVPGHGHSVSGKTDNLGVGKSFSVVEAHTLLMCWSRVA
ncbi:TPA: phage tail protein [Klebsiella pneumoniae]|uniref:phage tail protein n=1 Tax=Klebsiella pneumoniae TaxID=573 RepID=UPI0012EA3D4E|nr:phage tail protein [Klebsiella pneumoniae]HBT4864448.1 phage tail protein [Klebsiella pneumoniae]HEE0859912.1 phage tail protein [Klebsiella pneumoniae]